MVDSKSIKLLIKEIEQNIRTTDNTIKTFVDNGGILERMQNERNQIIFGRRGSGKTLLINNFLRNYPFTFHAKVNLEEYKTYSLPDSIIGTLITTLEQYKNQIESGNQSFISRFFSKKDLPINSINSTLSYLNNLLAETDEAEIETQSSVSSVSKKTLNLGNLKAGLNFQNDDDKANSTKKTFKINKLNSLNQNRIKIKNLIISISKQSHSKKIYLSLDDFYFLSKQNQPYFIDFFHNLSKGTNLILKVATIRQRTQLSVKKETFIGVDIGDDIQPIELDYTLDKFDTLKNFMNQIINAFIKSSYAESVEINDVIDEQGFNLLCVASGGVPRDFLTYFIDVCELYIRQNKCVKINDVYDISAKNLNNKLQNFEQDAQEDKDLLLECLNMIRDQIISNKRTNVFLLQNDLSAENDIWEQTVKELVDLRLLHQLSTNIKVTGKGIERYNAYLIDLSLYANNLKEKFNYVDINAISILEKQKLNSAPILSILNCS